MPPEEQTPPIPSKNRFSLDLRFVVVILLIAIAAMIVIWKPWDTVSSDDRTVSVTGEATISAEPDEYAFYPTYEFTSANQDTALTELTDKSNGITDELKALGVKDSQIKTNADGYDYPATRKTGTDVTTYTLQLTITVGDKKLAQKVQDYLLTTSPTGAVTPYPTFSEAKRKELESKARDQATKEARAKAEQSAKNLGFSVGKVKSVSDGAGFGDIYTLEGGASSLQAEDSSRSLALQPGENDLDYSVTVVYYVK